MRDGGRVNTLNILMASSQEMIEESEAGIEGKLLYHWGKSEKKGKKYLIPMFAWRSVWSQQETDS